MSFQFGEAHPSGSTPLAFQRSCQVWPGSDCSQSSTLIRPLRRWRRLAGCPTRMRGRASGPRPRPGPGRSRPTCPPQRGRETSPAGRGPLGEVAGPTCRPTWRRDTGSGRSFLPEAGHTGSAGMPATGPAMSRQAGMPRSTAAWRAASLSSSASLAAAAARLTLSPSASPVHLRARLRRREG